MVLPSRRVAQYRIRVPVITVQAVSLVRRKGSAAGRRHVRHNPNELREGFTSKSAENGRGTLQFPAIEYREGFTSLDS